MTLMLTLIVPAIDDVSLSNACRMFEHDWKCEHPLTCACDCHPARRFREEMQRDD